MTPKIFASKKTIKPALELPHARKEKSSQTITIHTTNESNLKMEKK